MKNYKLGISYDGSAYAGWQIQHNAVTVQQKISDALRVLLKEDVNLVGSGRTDTGVHAIGQTANFKTSGEIDAYRFLHSLNSMLPFDISINSMEEVGINFNARYDAVRRSYLYFIINRKNPFWNRYAYRINLDLDPIYLNELSRHFLGERDFSSFCRTNTETENKVCSIYDVHWRRQKGITIFKIEGSRFLHGMVRAITGTILYAVKNKLDGSYIEEVLNAKNRAAAGESVPAHGLFLYKVKYK